MPRYKVLLIEDHEAYQETCVEGLANYNIQTIIAGNGKDGLEILRGRGKEVDLVLLDYMLPDGRGINFLEKILHLRPKLPVIILTALELESSVRAQLITMGAADFMIKSTEFVELAARIEVRIERPEPDVTQYQFGGWILDVRGRRLMDPDGVIVSLSSDEWNFLLTFLQNPGTIINRCELENQLHSAELLNRKISSLRQKLQDDDREKFIATVRGQGYQFVMDVTAS